MRRFGVVGNPVAHSLSPQIHRQFAEQVGVALDYERIETTGDEFSAVVREFFALHPTGGLNITMPFKNDAFALADHASPEATSAAAANTLWMHDGQLHAHTTDGEGLLFALEQGWQAPRFDALVLVGAGGAVASALPYLWQRYRVGIRLLNRSKSRAEQLARSMRKQFPSMDVQRYQPSESLGDLVVVDGSGSVFHGEISEPLDRLAARHQVAGTVDMGYKQDGTRTPMQAWADMQGLPSQDGTALLVGQAAASFTLWHKSAGKPDPVKTLAWLRKN